MIVIGIFLVENCYSLKNDDFQSKLPDELYKTSDFKANFMDFVWNMIEWTEFLLEKRLYAFRH